MLPTSIAQHWCLRALSVVIMSNSSINPPTSIAQHWCLRALSAVILSEFCKADWSVENWNVGAIREIAHTLGVFMKTLMKQVPRHRSRSTEWSKPAVGLLLGLSTCWLVWGHSKHIFTSFSCLSALGHIAQENAVSWQKSQEHFLDVCGLWTVNSQLRDCQCKLYCTSTYSSCH